ncbi:MAG: acetyl-CoA carboxylase biotin carboxyl carrier protein subunit [Paludibacteraceae bacterium]|jgi:biotin carboxyl carrier protein|nr:acetyl-CoA carboxylase biotin carboxyl carrier protein subunit [Paludibacteraceae bacterium]
MEVHIGGRIANVELISKDGNNVVIRIDDKEYNLDVVMPEAGVCSILHNSKSYNAEYKRKDKSYIVNTQFHSFPVEIVDSQAKYLRNRKKEDVDEQQDRIFSPMPGKIVKVLVEKGQEMHAGDAVVVVEAMKMQSEYKVKRDCKIKDILIAEGDTIDGNQTLVTLE